MNHPDFEGFSEEDEAIAATNEDLLNILALTIDNIDLEKEIVDRYAQARILLLEAKNEPVGQKAAMLRAATDILRSLVKTKTDLYNAERIKVLEQTLIEVLQDFPQLKDAFLERYEKALKNEPR